jgi:hypothetical protein
VKVVLDGGWFEWLGGHGFYTFVTRRALTTSTFSRSGWSILSVFAGSLFLGLLWILI